MVVSLCPVQLAGDTQNETQAGQRHQNIAATSEMNKKWYNNEHKQHWGKQICTIGGIVKCGVSLNCDWNHATGRRTNSLVDSNIEIQSGLPLPRKLHAAPRHMQRAIILTAQIQIITLKAHRKEGLRVVTHQGRHEQMWKADRLGEAGMMNQRTSPPFRLRATHGARLALAWHNCSSNGDEKERLVVEGMKRLSSIRPQGKNAGVVRCPDISECDVRNQGLSCRHRSVASAQQWDPGGAGGWFSSAHTR